MSCKLIIEPDHLECVLETGETILDGIRKMPDLHFETPCNGNGSCGKCRVKVLGGSVNEPAEGEEKLLGKEQLSLGYRLACYAVCQKENDVITVSIPKKAGNDIVLGDLKSGKKAADPLYPAVGDSRYGIAVDIGTTTVVCTMLDLRSGDVAAKASSINPQTAIGSDVLSRIAYTMTNSGGLKKLQSMIIGCLNDLTEEMIQNTGIRKEEIAGYTVAANCTMLHLLLGADPQSLACVPFTPVFTSGQNRKAHEMGLTNCSENAGLYCIPSVSAYIGADIVAGIHVTDLIHAKRNVMFIDIGTNGEIVFSKKGELWACSCAAGPAMEGMNISSGMRAADGAIENISVKDGKFAFRTIGGGAPQGLCGSGVLETVAALLKSGGINTAGRVVESKEIAPYYFHEGKVRGYLIYDGNTKIRFTQADVRQIQLAKGAILSGFQSLVEEAGISLLDLDEVIIAGQFGSYINENTILDIGILPREMKGKVRYIGNSSLEGAADVLLDKRLEADYENLAGKVHYLELGSKKGYTDLFMNCLVFPKAEGD